MAIKGLLAGVIVLFGSLAIWVAADIHRNNQIEKTRSRPEHKEAFHVDRILYDLEHEKPVDWSDLASTLAFVNGRYDTADFRLQSLTRIVYKHWHRVDPHTQDLIRDAYLGLKYWMDQPGADGMCFWSENHQILFASSEYLAGQRWPDAVFVNDGRTGSEHRAMARERILTWLELRWLYGFTEWYSTVYYVEDIAPLSNLIEFAEDKEIVTKATIILDLLLHDVATQSYRGTFISTSGRLYQSQKFGGAGNSMKTVIEHIWGKGRWGYQHEFRKGMDLNFVFLDGYTVPDVIKAIGEDDSEVVIKASNGLNVRELRGEGLYGIKDPQIMMQWAMEAFTNPEVITNSLKYISKYDMFGNEFLHDFRMLNIGLVKALHLLPAVSRLLNPVTNGVAIQRANTYTYKTADYMLATAQSYHPGMFGDQQHIWNATISDRLSIFTTHPAKSLADEGALSGSPGYWVGSGRLPHAAQDKNIVLIIYRIPDRPGLMEAALVDHTHAHFPRQAMDEAVFDGRYAFGREGNAFFALVARNELAYRADSDHDLIQHGKQAYWIFEISTADREGSFDDFMQRIKRNPVGYDGTLLSYRSDGRLLELEYQHHFRVDGSIVETEHPRFQSPYSQTGRKPQTITLFHAGRSLFLDFGSGARVQAMSSSSS
jgi:hypothetical protein